MNSFSSFAGSSLTGIFSTQTTNINSMSYIFRYAKNLTIDFSGSDYTSLYNASYSYTTPTSSGLNPSNQNTTFARLKYIGNTLKSTDFVTSSSSFTIYMKHAARFSTVSPFNLQYPSSATFSSSVVESGSSFTTNFYSMLDPGSVVPYSFTGCTSANLNGASLTGTFTAPYGTRTDMFIKPGYVISPSMTQQTMTISVVPFIVITYYVKVSGTNFTLSTTSGGTYVSNLAISREPTYNSDGIYNYTYGDTLGANDVKVYKFDQSDSSNTGKTLVFKLSGGTITPIAGTIYGKTYTSNVTYSGTAGIDGITTIIVKDSSTPDLYYTTIDGGVLGNQFKRLYSFNTTYFTSGTSYYRVHMALESSSNLVLNVPSGTIINYSLIGGGSSGTNGGKSNGDTNKYQAGGGGGGGINISGQYTTSTTQNYTINIQVGNGGSAGGNNGISSTMNIYSSLISLYSSATNVMSATASGGIKPTSLGSFGLDSNTKIIIGSNTFDYFNNKNPYIGSDLSYEFYYNGYNNTNAGSINTTIPMLVNDWWGSGYGNGRLGGRGFIGGSYVPSDWADLPANENNCSQKEQVNNPCLGGGGFGGKRDVVSPMGGVPYTGGGGGGGGVVPTTSTIQYGSSGGCGTCYVWYQVQS